MKIEKNKKTSYKAVVTWDKKTNGFLCSFGKQKIRMGNSLESRADESVWAPEELFVASVNACIKTSFMDFAKKDNFEFVSYKSQAQGTLKRVKNKFMCSKITITPTIVVSSDDKKEEAKRLMRLAQNNCFITNLITSEVVVNPEIKIKAQNGRF